jgi:type I restriction enzyme S subunit
MKKYDNYKDSGIKWLGEIPKHWRVTKLKFIGDAIGGLTYAPNNVVEDETKGILVLRSSNIQNGKLSLLDNVYVNLDISEKLTLKMGDILICSRNGSQHLIGKNICIDERNEGNTFGAFMMIFRSSNYQFLNHFFNSPIFTSQSGLFLTATINQLTSGTLNNFYIAIPDSLQEQTAIANYLDQKTTQIDQLINQKQRFIELLKEERTVVINQAVTKGLDPTVKMKDSGIEWLGEIPEHWEVKKLKYLISKKIDNRGKTPPFGEIGRPMLEVKQIKDNNIHPSKKFEKFSLQKELIGFIREEVKENDVLIATVGATAGKCCIVPKNSEFFIAQNVIGFRCNSQMDSLFFYYMIESTYFKDSLLAINKSNTIDNLKVSVFINNYCIVPPIDEQIILSKLISDNIDKITKLTRKLNQEIELLKEYKTTLISEVVTGKVDVRDVVLN